MKSRHLKKKCVSTDFTNATTGQQWGGWAISSGRIPTSDSEVIKKAAMEQEQYMDSVKRIWYLSPMRAAKVQASLRIRAVSPEPSLLAHTSSESRGTFRKKARSLAPLNGWACAVKICDDGMLEDTNSLDGAHIKRRPYLQVMCTSQSCLTILVSRVFVFKSSFSPNQFRSNWRRIILLNISCMLCLNL